MRDDYKWDDDDIVVDHTKKVKKIWDMVMPQTYPYLIKFKTIGVKEVTHEKRMGPYSFKEHKVKFLAHVLMDSNPLVNAGWDGETKIDEPLLIKAYGKDYFIKMREQMRDLLGYIGLGNFSNFDFEGHIQGAVNEDPQKFMED